ncbi:hypothetical protein, partial [Paenibacillus thiaminolyticus]
STAWLLQEFHLKSAQIAKNPAFRQDFAPDLFSAELSATVYHPFCDALPVPSSPTSRIRCFSAFPLAIFS